jgi:hypothetical protein
VGERVRRRVGEAVVRAARRVVKTRVGCILGLVGVDGMSLMENLIIGGVRKWKCGVVDGLES